METQDMTDLAIRQAGRAATIALESTTYRDARDLLEYAEIDEASEGNPAIDRSEPVRAAFRARFGN